MNKNPIIAFLLAFFPGGGLMYLGKVLRGFFYTAVVFGIPALSAAAVFMTGADFFLVFALGGLLMYLVNFIDTVVTASKLYNRTGQIDEGAAVEKNPDSERFFTIVLSFIPGLGHFQLGLVYRGMTLLAVFLGLGAMILFVTMMTGRTEFLVFLASLPVIWIYGFFDVMQLLDRKSKGETLVDRSVLEEFEKKRPDSSKSKAIATLLSIVPGAGHLYLGLQKRGIQLMAAFLLSIYILDVLRLGIFLFIVPIIWFYSFFDGLQKASQSESGELEDEPIVSYLINHQKWIGIGLILLGLYYIGMNIIIPMANPILGERYGIDLHYWIYSYVQPAIICLILIGGGIKLLSGKKADKEGEAK
ncbi:membrane protein [Bacillus freudenreichii]|nr:membrane protein [Bacillus freudenreichii]